ncbi:thiamine pyrophosphate-binding protein [Spirosoma taeanense]|uniref:Thiamine pyrophosphate-binding protein n=1 Tax=Spirosoma taeanense TaxID=2735870 RepID=A0A6M5YA60_9BACT|nr:thiamine pyrophosphate-binding protein [Spirosoma taeanense]QJW90170.1 thiamine pyrophosphate-binding protein [Spirosoma taeanense]
MNVSDYIVRFLKAVGVRQVFGYPGTPILPFMAALERQSDIEWVLMRHENAAAMAASAQARLTGELTVCMATSGPGSANFICGLVDAQLDRAPVLALTGLVPTYNQGHSEFQDINQAQLLSTVLPMSNSCVHPRQLVPLLRNSVGFAWQNQQTAHLALSSDVLNAQIADDDSLFAIDVDYLPRPLRLMPPPEEAFNLVADELMNSHQVVIVVGRRAVGCGASITQLAEKLGAPIITSLDGKGIVDETHAHTLGVLGIFGLPGVESTKQIIRQADAILAFGVDTLKPFLTDADNAQRRKLIQCEAGFNTISLEYRRTRTLVGPLETIAERLAYRVGVRQAMNPLLMDSFTSRQVHLQEVAELNTNGGNSNYVHPAYFLTRLNRFLDETSMLVLDTGAHTVWAARYLQLAHQQPVIVSSHLGTMGFSLPALIGIQMARPNHRAVGISGDGGFQMVMGELATAVQNKLPIILIIFSNGVLQNVRTQQDIPFGTYLYNPDFVALAKAFGADSALIDGQTDIDTVLTQAFAKRDRPFLLECKIDPELEIPLSRWERLVAVH